MTTPFIIALGLGVSKLKGESKGEENSFGLVGIASAGPILAGLIMSMSINSTNVFLEEAAHQSALISGLKSSTFANKKKSIFGPYLYLYRFNFVFK